MPYLILWACLALALLIVRLSLGSLAPGPRLDVGVAQTVGRREVYADAHDWARFGDETMFAVANGIGRGRKGELAANEAVETLVRLFEATGASENPKYFFECAFRAANTAILQRVADGTAGASLLCAVVRDGLLTYALVGNCRIGVCRRGDFVPLSEGQTVDVLARKAFRQGQITRQDALAALGEKRLYGFVGHDGFAGIELFDVPVRLQRGDVVALMTDGVYEFCTAKQLEDSIRRSGAATQLAKHVIQILERRDDPEQDNATLVLAKVNRV